MPSTTEKELTRREFAALLGVRQSYITQLAHDGRLVFSRNGKKVLVDDSLQLIKQTADPEHDELREKWVRYRNNKTGNGGHSGNDSTAAPAPDTPNYASARALKEQYRALSAKADYEQRIGTLVQASDVQRAAMEAGAQLRSVLERLPDLMAPTLAPVTDEAQMHALLREHIEQLLSDLSARFQRLAKPDSEKSH